MSSASATAPEPRAGPRRPAPPAGRPLLVAAAALIASSGLLPVLRWGGNVDVAWYLYVARRVLGGARLYRDIVEINPPLVVIAGMPAALLSRLLGVSDLAASAVLTATLVAACVVLAARWLARLLDDRLRMARRVIVLLLLAALFPFAVADFGQREHLLLALVAPYLCLSAARAAGRAGPPGEAALAGVLAGLGLALKPFYAPLWLLTEALLLVRRAGAPWRRPETIAIAGVLATYAAAVPLLFPDYLPLALRLGPAYAWLLRRPIVAMLGSVDGALAPLGIAALLIARGTPAFAGLRSVLAVALAASLGAVLIQHKGWSYHYLPVRGLAVLTLGAVLFAATWSRAARLRSVVAVAAIVALTADLGVALLRGAGQAVAQARFDTRLERQMVPLVRRYAAGGSVLGLTVSPSPAFPLVNLSGSGWAMRFPCLWMIPALYAREHWSGLSDSTRRRSRAERYLVDSVTEDLVRQRPALLVVYAPPQGAPDLAGYLARADRRFAAALAEYRPVGAVGGYAFLARDKAANP